jgi:PKD repeat protein
MEAAILEGGGDIGENSPPVADLQASPLSGPAPLTVTFDGSGSTDIDGVIVAHDWIFPDGSNDATEIVKHAFKTAGEHLIKLKVTDDFGDSDNAEITITVTAAEAIYYGDTTGDGTISAFDAAAILMHTAGITPLTGDAALSADVSGNGNISALDASYILQFSVGLIDCFPVEAGCPVK